MCSASSSARKSRENRVLRLPLEPREPRAHQRLMLGVQRDDAIDVLRHAGGSWRQASPVAGMITSVSRESVAYSAGVKNAGAYGPVAGVCASVTWTCWP